MGQDKDAVIKNFHLFSLGICLIYSGYSSTLVLQSSIRIEEGKGSESIAVAYVSAILVCFIVVPNIIAHLGVKYSMIVSEFCYVCFLVGLLIKNDAVLQLCSIMAGVGDAIFWTPLALLLVYYSKQLHRATPDSTERKCFVRLCGIIFPWFQMNSVLGNSIVYLVLRLSGSKAPASDWNSTATVTIDNASLPEVDLVEFCGANDCQDSEITGASMEQYVLDGGAITIFFLCLLAIQLAGITIHVKIVPNIDLDEVNNNEDGSGDSRGNKKGGVMSFIRPVADTLRLFVCSVNQWIIFLPGVFLGFNVALIYSEISRAFASCVLGVEKVSMCIIIYGLFYAPFSRLWSSMIAKHGQTFAIPMMAVTNTAVYLTCLMYQPSLAHQWVVYFIFALEGVAMPFGQLILSTFYSTILPNNMEASFNFWNVTFYIGWSIQFGWSPYVCVRDKLYFMIGILYLTVACLFVLKRRLKTSLSTPIYNNDDDVDDYQRVTSPPT